MLPSNHMDWQLIYPKGLCKYHLSSINICDLYFVSTEPQSSVYSGTAKWHTVLRYNGIRWNDIQYNDT